MAGQGAHPFTSKAVLGVHDHTALAHGGRDRPSGEPISIRIFELLTARLCHELSGPIAAISNGIELLAEEGPDFGFSAGSDLFGDAVGLVGDSARSARNRLQFYRFAYGSGQAGAIAGPAPNELAVRLFEASRISVDCDGVISGLSPRWQKLACNLLSFGAELLPRGGRLSLTDGPLALEATGDAAALSREARAAILLSSPIAELTPRTIQAYFTGLLARALDSRFVVSVKPRGVRLMAIAAG